MRQIGRAVIASTLVFLATGCGLVAAPSVPPPPGVQAMLAWLNERTLACVEKPGLPGARRWECTGSSGWSGFSADVANSFTVTIDADGQRTMRVTAALDATQTLGHELCPGLQCDPYTGFFADTIALSPVTGDTGAAIGKWVEANRQAGGTRAFDGLVVTYRPTMPIMSMSIEIESGQ